jgi:hypothetical protein
MGLRLTSWVYATALATFLVTDEATLFRHSGGRASVSADVLAPGSLERGRRMAPHGDTAGDPAARQAPVRTHGPKPTPTTILVRAPPGKFCTVRK